MKLIFRVSVVTALVLVLTLAYNFMSFNSIQPEAFDQNLPKVDSLAAEHLSHAVQFKTISHKVEMLDAKALNGLLKFLETTYPTFHQVAQKEIVSTHTLLYTWEGSDTSLKPVMYMGHMDVVPIERATEEQWIHPPFSGVIEDGLIYGRGTLDDKCTVIGLLEAAEMLAKEEFNPKRTIYILFGQDEEIGGAQGAEIVADRFKEEGLELEMIWDEGTVIAKDMVPGMPDEVALIGIAEKGYISYNLTCRIPGGHSSMPPINSAISNLNRALVAIADNPFPYEISKPVEGFIEYIGPVSPFMNKLAFSNKWIFEPLIFKSYAATGSGRALIQTSISATIVKAGVKDNVVPSKAQAVVNCRILPGENMETTLAYLNEIIKDTTIKITPQETQQNPSQSSDYNNAYFNTIGSVIKTVYPKANISPFLMLGATDSRHFDGLCDKIYKFAPFVYQAEDLKLLHGINEKISIENFNKGIQIYYMSIKNLNAL
jgi:carboxypeptidase PM20D1